MANSDQAIIIKRVKKAAHAHHGGAWKIAYADFVTAMMAFFLLLWLVSMTTPEQKKGLANYFAPKAISESTSGAGGLMGGTAMDVEGAQMSGSTPTNADNPALAPASAELSAEDLAKGGMDGQEAIAVNAVQASPIDLKSSHEQEFASAAASIRQAWQAMPNITEVADNLRIEETVEGLDIEIIDQVGSPMFPEGSKYPFEKTRQAIAAIAPILQKLSNAISISGHTAAGGKYENRHYGAWELSADRANTVRTILSEFGVSDDHIQSVIGRSTTEPFYPNDPYMVANERVRITVLYSPPPVPPGLAP